jgi:hypothetical protein
MPPELCSLYGTRLWESLDEAQRKRLSLCEIGNFFSLVLHGEKPLVQGLTERLCRGPSDLETTKYLRCFADEENKHMQMFGEFCGRYLGKIYPEKKVPFARNYAEGEEDVAFYCKVMVVEEYGDYYNVAIEKDERVDPTVREINRAHHADEARHLAFGRRHLAELFAAAAPSWSEATLGQLRRWLGNYLRASFGDYYNPQVYEDAGLADGYAVRRLALAHPACAQHRRRVAQKLVGYFMQHGLLTQAPDL